MLIADRSVNTNLEHVCRCHALVIVTPSCQCISTAVQASVHVVVALVPLHVVVLALVVLVLCFSVFSSFSTTSSAAVKSTSTTKNPLKRTTTSAVRH